MHLPKSLAAFGTGAALLLSLALPSAAQPRIDRIDPTVVDAGGPRFLLRILGANFVAGSLSSPGTTVTLTQLSVPRATVFVPGPEGFVSSSELRIFVDPPIIAQPDRIEVKVSELDSGKAILTVRGTTPTGPQPLNFYHQRGARRPSPRNLPMPAAAAGETFRTEILDTLRPTLWMSVPLNGTVDQLPKVSVDPTDLPPGNYTARVRTTVGQGTAQRQLISTVRLAVENQALIVVPPAVSFAVPPGSSTLLTKTINVTTRDGSRIDFGVAISKITGGNWLTASPNGTTPASISLAVNPLLVQGQGLKIGQLRVSDTRPGCSLAPVPIPTRTPRPQQASPSPNCEPDKYIYVFTGKGSPNDVPVRLETPCVWIGDSDPPANGTEVSTELAKAGFPCGRFARFRRSDEATMRVTATSARSIAFGAGMLGAVPAVETWLDARIQVPNNTFSPIPSKPSEVQTGTVAEVRAKVDFSALDRTTEALIDFNASGDELPGLIVAEGPDPSIRVSPGSIELTAASPRQELHVESTGQPVGFSVSINSNSNWISASPMSGTTGPQTTVVVSLASGAPPSASLNGSITITSPDAVNQPSVPVSATAASAPQIVVAPPRIDAESSVGGPPISRSLQVTIQGGAPSFTVSADRPWISAAATGSNVTVTLNPAGLPVGDSSGNVIISSAGAFNTPLSVPVVLRINPPGNAPFISDAGSAATYQSALTAPNTWIAIFGTNLANGPGRQWRAEELAGGRLPTNLDGTSVTINGKPAFVFFISPGLVNVLSPAETARGPVTIQVTKDGVRSNAFTANLQTYLPGILLKYLTYVAARHLDGTLVGNSSFAVGEPAVPAKPGEVITLYGTGFGDTVPPAPSGTVVPLSPLSEVPVPVNVLIDGIAAEVLFKGLTPGLAGLYFINIRLPQALTAGDKSVVVEVGGVRSPANFAYIPVQP